MAETFVYQFTAPAVGIHLNLHEPKKFKDKRGKEQGDPKYQASFMFEPDHVDLNALKAKAAQAAKSKWPNRDLKELQFPFANGDALVAKKKKELTDAGKEYSGSHDYYAGFVVLKSSSKFPARLAGIENKKVVDYVEPAQIAASKSKFYNGVKVLAEVNFVPYEGVSQNPDGVTAYVNMVLTTNTGARINMGRSAAEVFKGVAGLASTDDPTGGQGGVDDEIPF